MRDPKKMALKLLEEYGIKERPVSVRHIAERLGAKVVASDPEDDDISGMIYHEDGTTIIAVNETHGETRQRFTIAHEIGHLVLHSELIHRVHVDKGRNFRQKLYRDGRSKVGEDILEIESNRFAAELLMPTFLLKKDIKDFYIDFNDEPTEIAQLYNVSTQAMSIKLMELVGEKFYK